MKALTVKQPWAGLIIAGGKDIENRTWRTSYRGRVLIHAAKTPVPYAEIRDCYPLPVARTALLYNSSNRALFCGSIAKIYNNNSRHTPQQMVRSHLTWRYRHIA